jgi:hypothetical protein
MSDGSGLCIWSESKHPRHALGYLLLSGRHGSLFLLAIVLHHLERETTTCCGGTHLHFK